MTGVATKNQSSAVVTFPEILGPFRQDPKLSDGMSRAYIATRFCKAENGDGDEPSWELTTDVDGHEEVKRNVFTFLGTPTGIVTAEQEAVWEEDDWDRHAAQRDRYDDALGALSRITTLTAVELFPKVTVSGQSRMGRHMTSQQVNRLTNVVVLRISRGGDTPAAHAKRVLNKILRRRVQILQATAQRKIGPHGGLVVDYTIKGRTPLKDKILFVPEQALATGGTLVEVLTKLFSFCGSTPLHLIIGALNVCEDGIRTVLQAFPSIPTTILGMSMHNALTIHWYLDEPGMGDGGAEEALVED